MSIQFTNLDQYWKTEKKCQQVLNKTNNNIDFAQETRTETTATPENHSSVSRNSHPI